MYREMGMTFWLEKAEAEPRDFSITEPRGPTTKTLPRNYPDSCSQREPEKPKAENVKCAT